MSSASGTMIHLWPTWTELNDDHHPHQLVPICVPDANTVRRTDLYVYIHRSIVSYLDWWCAGCFGKRRSSLLEQQWKEIDSFVIIFIFIFICVFYFYFYFGLAHTPHKMVINIAASYYSLARSVERNNRAKQSTWWLVDWLVHAFIYSWTLSLIAMVWDGDEFDGGRRSGDEAATVFPSASSSSSSYLEKSWFSLEPSSSSTSSSSPASCTKPEMPIERSERTKTQKKNKQYTCHEIMLVWRALESTWKHACINIVGDSQQEGFDKSTIDSDAIIVICNLLLLTPDLLCSRPSIFEPNSLTRSMIESPDLWKSSSCWLENVGIFQRGNKTKTIRNNVSEWMERAMTGASQEIAPNRTQVQQPRCIVPNRLYVPFGSACPKQTRRSPEKICRHRSSTKQSRNG